MKPGRVAALAACVISLFVAPAAGMDASYDAQRDFGCNAGGLGSWQFEAYRAEDASYLEMVSGHAPITEISRYGVDAFYLPDGDQPYHPYIVRFPGRLMGSPATRGGRFDLVLTFTAYEAGDVTVTGFAELLGDFSGRARGRTVKAQLLFNGDVRWEDALSSGETERFDLAASVSPGDKLHLKIINMGDDSDNITAFNMQVTGGAEGRQ